MDSSQHLISEGYQTLIRKMHSTTNWGDGSHRRAERLLPLVRSVGYKCSILDYGCGKGTLGPALLHFMPALRISDYDPGIAGKDTPPTDKFDLVISTDVLEHIESEHIEAVLAHMASITGGMLYATIGLELAKHILPDGRNAHILVRPVEWWITKLEAAGFQILERKTDPKRFEVLLGIKE